MNSSNTRLTALAAILLALGLGACERQGAAERAGERVDESVERAGEAAEEAGDEVEDKTDQTR
ncbi:MAG: hypothetical protein ACREXR_13365 [Gammaproteobacteria bacterium]